MLVYLRKSVTTLLLSTLIASVFPVHSQNLYGVEDNVFVHVSQINNDGLPEMGTSAGSTLSIAQEINMGDYYSRQLRASSPLLNDPLLLRYLDQLGQRLVSHASSVKTPFHYFLVNESDLNAFAFFGGNVVINSGIFRYSDNESQLASVLAHEISHVTQRHLARAMEEQKSTSSLAWVGTLGALVLATASPQAGMAALTSTLAGSQQGVVSFTQSNEQEADRIGIVLLKNAGFDPQAMPDFLQKLADQSRGASKPPEMLLTHPLPDSRLSDVRNRANQMQRHSVASSLDFLLAKVRVLEMYSDHDQSAADNYLQQLTSGNNDEKMAARYGLVLKAYQEGNNTKAHDLLEDLLSTHPDNLWFLDSATDVDIANNRPSQAVKRLENKPLLINNPVLQLNLANAYLENGQYAKAQKLLSTYTFLFPDDLNGWALLEKACAMQLKRNQEVAARAEGLALKGDIKQSIDLLENAAALSGQDNLEKQRYIARIGQLKALQKRFNQYNPN